MEHDDLFAMIDSDADPRIAAPQSKNAYSGKTA